MTGTGTGGVDDSTLLIVLSEITFIYF